MKDRGSQSTSPIKMIRRSRTNTKNSAPAGAAESAPPRPSKRSSLPEQPSSRSLASSSSSSAASASSAPPTAATPPPPSQDGESSDEWAESGSLSFTYRKKREEQHRRAMERQNGSRLVSDDLDASCASEGGNDDESRVSGLSSGSGSTKGSSKCGPGSTSGSRRQSLAGSLPPGVKPNPLYLLRCSRRPRTEPIQFSGGMGYEECAKFYRLKRLDFVLERPSSRPQQAAPAPTTLRRSNTAPAESTSGMSPAKLKMIERLKKMGHTQYDASSAPQRTSSKATATKNAPDDTSNSTLSTIGLDESVNSLDESQSSHVSAGSAASQSVASQDANGKRRRQRPRFAVTFSRDVDVHRVPSAKSYPPSVRAGVWYSRQEWAAQKKVCRLELMADGPRWWDATEEGDYVQDPKTHRAVHPVHVKGLTKKRVEELGRSPMKLLGGLSQSQSQPPATGTAKGQQQRIRNGAVRNSTVILAKGKKVPMAA
uniref:Uncharacterized protein n=1 Tax=Pseudictyota dubia TaxID=2749911 RepID=A0A7R9ZHX5_9STRA